MRARNIKPGFFSNEELAELPAEARLLFAGLWTLADRDGRLEDRPKRIRGTLFPFDDWNIDSLLELLAKCNCITRYVVNDRKYIWIKSFLKHQKPHPNEKPSVIPPYSEKIASVREKVISDPAESLNPESLNPSLLNPECPVREKVGSDSDFVEESNPKEIPAPLTTYPAALDTFDFKQCWEGEWIPYMRHKSPLNRAPAMQSQMAWLSELARYGPDKALQILKAGISANWATVNIKKWAESLEEKPGDATKPKSKMDDELRRRLAKK